MEKSKTNDTIKKLLPFVSKDIAEQIEKGIYDFSDNYASVNETIFLLESIYDTKLDEVIESLSNNPELKIKLADAYNIAFLEPDKMNPNKYDNVLKKKEIEDFKKSDIKSSNVFTCSKCKKSKCQVTQKQIRAGDEPATTFVTCLECGNTFSFN